MPIKPYPSYLSTVLGIIVFFQEDMAVNLCLEHFVESIYSLLIFAAPVKMPLLLHFLIAIHWEFIR